MGGGLIITLSINIATLALSVASALFIAGVQLGRMKTDIKHMKDDIAEIRRLFRLQIRRNPRRK